MIKSESPTRNFWPSSEEPLDPCVRTLAVFWSMLFCYWTSLKLNLNLSVSSHSSLSCPSPGLTTKPPGTSTVTPWPRSSCCVISVPQAQRWNVTARRTRPPCALRVRSGALLSSGTGARAANTAPPSARRDSSSRGSVTPHTTDSASVYRDTTSLWSSAYPTVPVRRDPGSPNPVMIITIKYNNLIKWVAIFRPVTKQIIINHGPHFESYDCVMIMSSSV